MTWISERKLGTEGDEKSRKVKALTRKKNDTNKKLDTHTLTIKIGN